MRFYDKVRRQKFLSFTVILFTLAIGILIGTVVQTGAKAAREQQAAPDATPLVVPSPVAIQSEFSKIAKRLEPSVVNISTEYLPKRVTTSNRQTPNPRRRQAPQDDGQDDDGMQGFLQRFFGGGGGGGGQFQFGEPDVPSAATGSGVVVDPNGYIITNNHVVEKATKIKVKFMGDSAEYPATVIGTDSDTDIAVIHIDRKGLPAAKIGNSDALQVGDWAMAIGSPFGFQATVTAGIVSALSRDIPDNDNPGRTFQHFIQTDAAINPGNSGGPLINMNGEVIGINTMIASRSGGYQGIGFAMPINTVAKVYNQIISQGHVSRGSIGITFNAEENPSLLSVYGADHGVFVNKVEPGGPAEKAGVKVEDVITSINGKQIKTGQDLIDIVADSPIGSTLKVGVVRDKKPMTLDITVGDRQHIFASLYGGAPQTSDHGAEGAQLKFGMSVSPISPSDRDQMGLKTEGGVQITSVEEGSFAYDLGLQRGDVIVELNRQPVNSTADIRKIQGNLKPGDAVAFHVMRQTGGTRGGGDWVSFFPAGKVPEGN
ncbi:MAG: Do family serine endopeptidase [Acidobacteriota bacterium]|nr:Do family serine endopeptidase [Acidobacteriota bacterium]